MKIYILPLFVLIANAQNKFEVNSYSAEPNVIFEQAYERYENKDYRIAIESFRSVCSRDSFQMFYEGYGFIAECYNRIGLIDSGIVVYTDAIKRVQNLINYYPQIERLKWIIDSLRVWKNNYPIFPNFLRKEYGFIPRDEWGKLVYSPAPNYPEYARRGGVESTTYLKGFIQKDGTVANISVVASGGKEFDREAILAFSQYKFTPFKIKGRVSIYEVVLPFNFRLN